MMRVWWFLELWVGPRYTKQADQDGPGEDEVKTIQELLFRPDTQEDLGMSIKTLPVQENPYPQE